LLNREDTPPFVQAAKHNIRSYLRRIRTATGNRKIVVSPDSALKYLFRDLRAAHRELFRFAESFVSAGDHVWDVGANVGVFSVAAAAVAGRAGQVVALEPDPFLVDLLVRTTKLRCNADLNMLVRAVAIMDVGGGAELSIASRGRSSNVMEAVKERRASGGGSRGAIRVATETLDELSQFTGASPDVIKIDVEGAEDRALVGATRVSRDARPVILVEVGKNQNAAVTRALLDHDYQLYDGEDPAYGRTRSCVFNTLAIPSERVSLLMSGKSTDLARGLG